MIAVPQAVTSRGKHQTNATSTHYLNFLFAYVCTIGLLFSWTSNDCFFVLRFLRYSQGVDAAEVSFFFFLRNLLSKEPAQS